MIEPRMRELDHGFCVADFDAGLGPRYADHAEARIRDAVSGMSPWARTSGLVLSAQVDDAVPAEIQADPLFVRQVLRSEAA